MCRHPASRRAHLKLSAERGTTSAKSCEHTVVRARLSRCTAQLCFRAGGSAEVVRSLAGVRWLGSQRTSILMRPALCPPIEMSKKTTGLPPAAPGIEPIPDMAQGKSWQEQRSGGCGGQWALQKHRRRGSEGGGRANTRRAGARGERPAGAASSGVGGAGKRACVLRRTAARPRMYATCVAWAAARGREKQLVDGAHRGATKKIVAEYPPRLIKPVSGSGEGQFAPRSPRHHARSDQCDVRGLPASRGSCSAAAAPSFVDRRARHVSADAPNRSATQASTSQPSVHHTRAACRERMVASLRSSAPTAAAAHDSLRESDASFNNTW